MKLPAWHDHISEREGDGTWEDCTWDAGLEWYRLTNDKSKPATHAEAQKLRTASGEPPTGGSNQSDFRAGVKARYGTTIVDAVKGFANLWRALVPGTAGSVQGTMNAFGPGHRLSRWQKNFDGGHCVLVMRLDNTDRVWWCDPLATDTGYNGEWATKGELERYVTQFGGEHLVDWIIGQEPQEEDMPTLTTYVPGSTANVKGESNIRSAPVPTATNKLRTVPKGTKEAVVLTGTVKGSVDPANGSDVWYVWWKNARWEYTAKDNIVDVQPPVGADCSVQEATIQVQAAEIASLKTDLAASQAETEAAEAATATAAEAERERIAQAEADRIKAL